MAHAYGVSSSADREESRAGDEQLTPPSGSPAALQPGTAPHRGPFLDWSDVPDSEFVAALRATRQWRMEATAASVASAGAGSGLEASRQYAAVVDDLIKVVFDRARRQFPAGKFPGDLRVALASVGSYARQTLSLASDVDIRVLVSGNAEQARELTEAMLYPLWDAGIDVGHQVVEAEGPLLEAAADLPTATALLDWRYLTGDDSLSAEFQQRVFSEVFHPVQAKRVIDALAAAAEVRRERYGSSVFLLEPDIKNGAGGLRDVDVLQWVARVRWRVSSLSELVSIGVLLPGEGETLTRALDFLVKVRNCLHRSQRRRVDRLGFVEQRSVAQRLGYGEGAAAVEGFMSEYYRNAQEIERLSSQVLRRAKPPARQAAQEQLVSEHLALVSDRIKIVDPDRIFTEPALALRCYVQALELSVEVDEPSRRAISRACSSDVFGANLRAAPEAAPLFRTLLGWSLPTAFRGDSIVRELNEVGLLVAMIPEFVSILGRVQHDAHHVYTVDAHSMVAVDVLRRLRSGHERELAHAREVAARLQRPELLALAVLLHDIGKEVEGRSHAQHGALMAGPILERLGLEAEDVQAAQALIRHHLKMYLFSFRRDLNEPMTVQRFVQCCPDLQALDELYVLSYCDVVATSPGAVNEWKLRMLSELHAAAERWLHRAEAASCPTAQAPLAPTTEHAVDDIPSSLLRHAPVLRQTREQPWAFRVLQVHDGVAELAFVGDDAPGLLARIAAVFARMKIKVVTAQLHCWRATAERSRVMDVFTVQTGFDAERLERECHLYEQEFAKIDADGRDPRSYVTNGITDARWSPREVPRIPLKIRFDNKDAARHTIVEVVTNDRADVLFWIADTLHHLGLTIDAAKVHVEGARVTDVFYVRSAQGKVVEPLALAELKQELSAVLQRVVATPDARADGAVA